MCNPLVHNFCQQSIIYIYNSSFVIYCCGSSVSRVVNFTGYLLHIFVDQIPAQAIFLFPFPLGIQKKFFSKSCLEFQCSHLYVNIFFVSLITKKWLFAKIRHSKSSGVLSEKLSNRRVFFSKKLKK